MSLARRTRERILAEQAAIAAGEAVAADAAPPMPEEGEAAGAYRNLLAALHQDLRRLKDIVSIENKIAAKLTMIDTYRPWVEGALRIEDGAKAPQDEIVVTSFLWALDTRDWRYALDLAAHVVGHGLTLPEHWTRTPAAVLVSDIGDAAINEPGSVPFIVLEEALAYVEPQHDMKDSYRARLFRAIGEDWARQAEAFDPSAETAFAGGKPALVEAALSALRRALALDTNMGAKKLIQTLEAEAKRLAAAAQTNDAAPDQDPPPDPT